MLVKLNVLPQAKVINDGASKSKFPATVRLAPLAREKSAVPVMVKWLTVTAPVLITHGLGSIKLITTLSVGAGTPLGTQLLAVFQLLSVPPTQYLTGQRPKISPLLSDKLPWLTLPVVVIVGEETRDALDTQVVPVQLEISILFSVP